MILPWTQHTSTCTANIVSTSEAAVFVSQKTEWQGCQCQEHQFENARTARRLSLVGGCVLKTVKQCGNRAASNIYIYIQTLAQHQAAVNKISCLTTNMLVDTSHSQ